MHKKIPNEFSKQYHTIGKCAQAQIHLAEYIDVVWNFCILRKLSSLATKHSQISKIKEKNRKTPKSHSITTARRWLDHKMKIPRNEKVRFAHNTTEWDATEREKKKSNVEKKLMQEIQKANNKTNRKTKQTMEALIWLEPNKSVGVGVFQHFSIRLAYGNRRYNIQYRIQHFSSFLTIIFFFFFYSHVCARARIYI